MRLSDPAIRELQAIYRAEFREELTTDEALEMGNRLLDLFSLLLRPLPRCTPDEHPEI